MMREGHATLLAFTDLEAIVVSVVETVGDVLRHGGLVGVRLGPDPHIDNPALVFRIERHFQYVAEAAVEQGGVELDLNGSSE